MTIGKHPEVPPRTLKEEARPAQSTASQLYDSLQAPIGPGLRTFAVCPDSQALQGLRAKGQQLPPGNSSCGRGGEEVWALGEVLAAGRRPGWELPLGGRCE